MCWRSSRSSYGCCWAGRPPVAGGGRVTTATCMIFIGLVVKNKEPDVFFEENVDEDGEPTYEERTCIISLVNRMFSGVGGAQTNNMTGFYQHHEYLTRFLVKFNDYYYCICFELISAASAAMVTEMDPLFGVSPHLAADRVDQLVSCRIDPYVSVVVSYIL